MKPLDRTLPEPTPARSVHPLAWTVLILPFGVLGGFAGVVLSFMATRRGLTVEQGASLVAIGMLPHTWKFLWGPVADLTLSRRRWYLGSAVLCAAGLFAMAAVPLGPSTLGTLRAIVFVANLASTTLGMAVEGMMSHLTPPEQRGRAGGWFQAGNLGGSGIGGGLGLWMATALPAPWMGGAVLGLATIACAGVLLFLPDVPRDPAGEGGVRAAVLGTMRDLRSLVTSRDGALAALLCFLPIGTGAAMGVMSQAEVAAQWGAGEREVGMVNGVASGVVMAAGCLLGGELCRRWAPRTVYAVMGAVMALAAAGMALAPSTPTLFVVGGLVYALFLGFAYAAFTGLVLETIEGGGAATKYNIFAALSNTPIAYMGLVMAWVFARWGADAMLFAEALAGLGALGVFYAAQAWMRRRGAALTAS